MTQRRIAGLRDRAGRLLRYAQAAHLCTGIDPWLLLAIADRESLCGEVLDQDGKGDRGNGCGIWQVDRRYHHTFVEALGDDGRPLWRRPAFNCLYAAELLQARILRFSGKTSFSDVAAIAAYNASETRVSKRLEEITSPMSRAALVVALDPLTTGKDYVSDVQKRRESIRKLLEVTA